MISPLIAIARTTFRAATRSRLNGVLLIFCLGLFGLMSVMTASSLNEDERLLKDIGLFLTSTLTILATLGLSAQSLHRELERKSLYSLLTKPIPRAYLIWGKFLGLAVTAFTLVMLMAGAWSLLALQLGVRFEPIMFAAWWLIWIEALIISAMALLIGSFSTPFVTSTLTFGVFLIGRFAPDLVSLSARAIRKGEDAPLLDLAMWILNVIPDLSAYNITEEVLYDGVISLEYIGQTSLSGLCYAILCLLGGAWLFSRRDLI